ncbi:acyltransferase family protein [Rhizobium leguminosarum]|uniref:acyltransferase family protein n=1 Tax=Rhizobium leguminosarum TaxID=384 RepID=UPI001C90DCC8|nr:acyltransferase family protein [Rhizobium leguminosarum]MBY2932515.1 acyltransferase [Rhizobium leguminosarum]
MLQATHPQPTTAHFRQDINGLRALAVVAVVLFHFGVPGFSGGFVGVDVFFVISGYLMTDIISRRLSVGRFNLIDFYLDRGRRIVPALSVMAIVLLGLGWLYLPTSELHELATESKTALLFYSNEMFQAQAGYFDKEASSKWMLHTWSLSVEWQFYVAYPVVLWAGWLVFPSRKTIQVLVAAIFAVSLGFLLSQQDTATSFAFYSLTTRAWEMAAGGLVCVFGHRLPKSGWFQLVGLVAIGASVFALHDGQHWPGMMTLLPVGGTALVLAAGSRLSFPRAMYPVEAVGSASYSIYLWHWPVVVALHFFQLQNNIAAIAAGLALSLVLGAISYAVIENPTRQLFKPAGAFINIAVISAVALAGIHLAGSNYRAADRRLIPQAVSVAEQTAYDFNPRRNDCLLFKGLDMPRCRYGEASGKLQAVVYGDSHADAIVTAVAASQPSGGYVEEWSYASCPTIFDVNLVINDRPCNEYNDWAKSMLKTIPSDIPVIVVNRFSSYPLGDEGLSRPYVYFSRDAWNPDAEFLAEYAEHFVSSVCEIAADHPVFLMRPVPEMPYSVPTFLARAAMITPDSSTGISRAAYEKRHNFMIATQNKASEQCGAKILDTPKYLCTTESCAGNDGLSAFYFDNSHLSETGNRKLVPMFRDVFKQGQEKARP